MKITKVIFLYIPLAVITSFSACKSDGSKNKSEPVLDELEGEEIMMEEQFFRFPSPEEVFSFLTESDVNFKESITNDAKKHKEYLDSKIQTLNIGIYIADLAYLTVFDRNDTFDYFEAIHTLSQKIQISAAFSDDLLNRVQKNLDNVDSLLILSDEAYKNIVDYLVANKMENSLALISIGAYIESLHISTSLVNDFETDADMVQKIADQRFAFENLYNYAEQNLTSKSEKNYLALLKEIKDIYDNMQETEAEESQFQEKEDGKLILSGGTKYAFSNTDFEQFKNAVKESRLKIIK